MKYFVHSVFGLDSARYEKNKILTFFKRRSFSDSLIPNDGRLSEPVIFEAKRALLYRSKGYFYIFRVC